MKKFIIILFLSGFFSDFFYSQDCNDYSKFADCRRSIKRHYNMYLQPKNASIGINDTLTYNVVFYGNRDYIISFCADQIYYPINIRLLQPETRMELYDNTADNYCVSIGVGFYNTQNVIIEATFLATNLNKDKITSKDKLCVGMTMQWKKIFKNIEN